MPKLAAPRGNSWGVPAYLFHPGAPPTYTRTHSTNFTNLPENCNSHAHGSYSPPAHTCLNHTPISRWAHHPCVCKLIANLWQNFLNQSRAKTIYPTHPPHSSHTGCASRTPLRSCFTQCDLSRHSSTSKNKDTQEHSAGAGNQTRRGQTERKHSDKPVTRILLNLFVPPPSAPQDDNPTEETRSSEKTRREKLIMNLLHVVSRRSLHVSFQSSRTSPENRNPAATWYVQRHTWQNGRVDGRGEKD